MKVETKNIKNFMKSALGQKQLETIEEENKRVK